MNASFAAGDQARATIVIVNFNGGANLLRCLESLAALRPEGQRLRPGPGR